MTATLYIDGQAFGECEFSIKPRPHARRPALRSVSYEATITTTIPREAFDGLLSLLPRPSETRARIGRALDAMIRSGELPRWHRYDIALVGLMLKRDTVGLARAERIKVRRMQRRNRRAIGMAQ